MTASRRTITQTAAIALVAVLGLSACMSEPTPRRVAEDLIRTETQDDPVVQDCMLGVLDDYDVNELGDQAQSDNEARAAEARAELDEFEADLAACRR